MAGAGRAGTDHDHPRDDDPAAADLCAGSAVTFNIVLSIMILLVAMFTQNTLEFSAFPTVLLFSTLLRLALNVASTRVI